MLQQYQTIGEIFFRFRAKTSLKKNEYHCVVQMHGLEHTQRFRWFQSNAVVQSFQFEFATHLTYIQGKHSRSIDRKYNYHECWCYIIRIKRCFPRTNQWLFLHVLLICLQEKWWKSLGTWMSVFGGHFSALFQCVMTVSWNQPKPGCWNYLYYIFVHSCMYTTQHFK